MIDFYKKKKKIFYRNYTFAQFNFKILLKYEVYRFIFWLRRLSLGLDNAGFKNYLSIEKSPMAAETFYHNFISRIEGNEWNEYLLLNINEQFEKGLIVNDLETVLNSNKIMNKIKQQKIDLVAGDHPAKDFH